MTNFEKDYVAWLARICREERPSPTVVAYNIGLFETVDGYSAYLVGRDHWDAGDDWVCAESFTPSEQYFPFPSSGFSGWEQVHNTVVEATSAFLHSPEGRQSYLAAAKAVTVGFDDGDLEPVH